MKVRDVAAYAVIANVAGVAGCWAVLVNNINGFVSDSCVDGYKSSVVIEMSFIVLKIFVFGLFMSVCAYAIPAIGRIISMAWALCLINKRDGFKSVSYRDGFVRRYKLKKLFHIVIKSHSIVYLGVSLAFSSISIIVVLLFIVKMTPIIKDSVSFEGYTQLQNEALVKCQISMRQ